MRWTAVLGLILLSGCSFVNNRPTGESRGIERGDLPQVRHLEGDRVYSFLRPDAIPAIDAPEFVAATDADFMADDELVLGVLIDGAAKAYSLWHLDRHEIVNDWFGDEPVAVTW